MTSRAGQTFSPIQNDKKVQETAKYRDKDEATEHHCTPNSQIRNPSASEVKHESETEVAAQKAVEAHNEVQKVAKGYFPRSTSSKTTIPTMLKKIETYKTASKKSEAAGKHEI